ncbi:MAG: 6-carboxytetrahydropterin synthase [Pelagibacteraceae bacterium]|nr:6-carboxytetrahydropterin synthase [Pelagibacteraceae bacterium]
MQTITREYGFDAGHRVMNERFKCFNAHGHRYHIKLTYSFQDMHEIGYIIDFKELKRVGVQWIDDMMDHGFIVNPTDTKLINTLKDIETKLYFMSLNGDEYCNPSVENVAREIFLAQEILFEDYDGLEIHHIRLNETPNCYTDVYKDSIPEVERDTFYELRYDDIKGYAKDKGIVEYDDRKV